MDTDTSLAHALTPLAPAAAPCPARWRQRDVAAADREHLDQPVAQASADAAPAQPPQRPARDDELWVLASRAQAAALRVDFELRTSLVRQVFRRDFVYVSRLLHALQASRRVQGLDRLCLDEALATLQRRAEDVQAMLQDTHARLQATIAAHAPPDAQIAFPRPARFQATVVSPSAHRYLALLTQADETLAQLEMAWLLGLVGPTDRAALASDCRRALNGYKDLVADRRQCVGEHVRQVNARRRHTTGARAGAGAGVGEGEGASTVTTAGPSPSHGAGVPADQVAPTDR